MKIELINKDIAEFTVEGKNHILNYGYRKKGDNLLSYLRIETGEKNLNIVATCPCTKINKVSTDYGYEVNLEYDSKRINAFSKVLKVVANQKTVAEITLRGTILN